jgi:hypothetical protein
MSDIQVTRNKHLALFRGVTIEGKNWLITFIGEDPTAIQVEYIADLIEDIKRHGLNVNEY